VEWMGFVGLGFPLGRLGDGGGGALAKRLAPGGTGTMYRPPLRNGWHLLAGFAPRQQ